MVRSRLVYIGSSVVVLVGAALAASCGDNIHPQDDDAGGGDASAAVCGNGQVEPGEECDDGDTMPDTLCDGFCRFTCGNGVVDGDQGELCDTGITGGVGTCPSDCTPTASCTTSVLSGSGCQAECVVSDITVPADDDGCCPPGADSTNDNDCTSTCGNGILETGELCDTGIPNGVGSCPTTCTDGMLCTADNLLDGGTCQARCDFPDITQPMNGDGCCPPGANTTNDSDCAAVCGNGVYEPPAETCDTAITAGPGRCPTSCNDMVACTRNILVGGGTCTAVCTFPDITQPNDNDGCCPTGANANNDNDCPPRCGNMVVEMGEQCDDGNTDPNDGCDMCMTTAQPPVAFRLSDLDLRDPHVYVSFIGCRDVTDTQLVGFSVNNELQTAIQQDDPNDNDTLLDLSIVLLFRPLDQANGATTNLEVHFADCTAPIGSTSCAPSTTTPIMTMAQSSTSGTCLMPLAGTTTPRMPPYSPMITSSTAPCFVSQQATITIDLGGIPITLRNARVGATYSGNPATSMVNGLLMGFISEADANNTIIPASFPLVGGDPLSSLLPGGDPPGPGNANCAAHDDRDTFMNTRGWWFYLNFPATRVPWTGP